MGWNYDPNTDSLVRSAPTRGQVAINQSRAKLKSHYMQGAGHVVDPRDANAGVALSQLKGLLGGVLGVPDAATQARINANNQAEMDAFHRGGAGAGVQAALENYPDWVNDVGMNYLGAGAIVWQGGPHKYGHTVASDIPSERRGTAAALQHIGSGEGNAAFGYGDYRAGAENVAKDYREKLSGTTDLFKGREYGQIENPAIPYALRDIEKDMRANGMGIEDAKLKAMEGLRVTADRQQNMLKSVVEGSPSHAQIKVEYENTIKAMDEIASMQQTDLAKVGGGYLYKHDLPDEDIARYLDWDKKIKDQPQSVKDGLAYMFGEGKYLKYGKERVEKIGELEGRQLMEGMFDDSGLSMSLPDTVTPGKKGASEALARAGIPGLKYYDGMSRNAGEGTRNYVTWDQDVLNRMKLLERNSQPYGPVRQSVLDDGLNGVDMMSLLDETNIGLFTK